MPERSLQDAALEILNHPESYSPFETWKEHELILRIWLYHALDSYSTWLLHEHKNVFQVRRLEWDRGQDARWPKGTPSIYGCENTLPPEQTVELIERLRAISLPALAGPSHFGIDGIIYGVETKGTWLNARLSWWCDPPEGWNDLAIWFDDAVQFFDGHLPTSTARMRK